jgi:Zn-dependent alcohol dehydrogenase
MVRLGAVDSPPKTPFILGFECAGEVEVVGEGVEDFKVSHFVLLGMFAKADMCWTFSKE